MVQPLRQHSSYAPRLRLLWDRPLNKLATLRFSLNTESEDLACESWPKKIMYLVITRVYHMWNFVFSNYELFWKKWRESRGYYVSTNYIQKKKLNSTSTDNIISEIFTRDWRMEIHLSRSNFSILQFDSKHVGLGRT